MANKLIPIIVTVVLLAGVIDSCKHPTEVKPIDSTKCDTCHTDSTQHPCDTCNHSAADTTSHNFQWTEMTIAGESNLTGVWVNGPNDIWCNGNDLYHYDGVSWTKKTFSTSTVQIGALSGYSLFSPDSTLWLTHGSIIDHCFPQTGYAIQYRPDVAGGILHAAWGTSSTDMFFVGDNGTILHFDGTTWTNYPKVTTNSLGSIYGTTDNDIWAAGFDPQTAESVLLHYDGTSWSNIDLSQIGNIGVGYHGLGGVWTTDSSGHKIVYVTGSLVWHKKDNGPWMSDSGKIGNEVGQNQFIGLYYSHGNRSTDYMIAADGGFITHWNGRNWHLFEGLFSPNDPNYVTHGMSFRDNTSCIIGSKSSNSWILLGQR